MILFARDCADGTAEKCFYADAPKKAVAATESPSPSQASMSPIGKAGA